MVKTLVLYIFIYIVFTDDMLRECDNQDFTYHMRKNDLKWYLEMYVKYKNTMRK